VLFAVAQAAVPAGSVSCSGRLNGGIIDRLPERSDEVTLPDGAPPPEFFILGTLYSPSWSTVGY